MDGGSAFRRAFHLASPIFLGYYLLPDPIAGNITRTAVTALFLGTAWCIEIARIALGLRVFGMRPYEGQRVSAYAQGSIGLAFGLFVIQDPRIVVPAFVGMAWIDPFAHFARKRKWPRFVPVAAYAALFLSVLVLVDSARGGYEWWTRLLFTALATGTAILVEGPVLAQIDDDLLMQVVPMTAASAFGSLLVRAGLL